MLLNDNHKYIQASGRRWGRHGLFLAPNHHRRPPKSAPTFRALPFRIPAEGEDHRMCGRRPRLNPTFLHTQCKLCARRQDPVFGQPEVAGQDMEAIGTSIEKVAVSRLHNHLFAGRWLRRSSGFSRSLAVAHGRHKPLIYLLGKMGGYHRVVPP